MNQLMKKSIISRPLLNVKHKHINDLLNFCPKLSK